MPLRMKKRLLLFAFLTVTASLSQSFAQNYDTNHPVVETFVGSGFYGYLDEQGTQTMFNGPWAVVADTSSNLVRLLQQSHPKSDTGWDGFNFCGWRSGVDSRILAPMFPFHHTRLAV